jgi:NapC/NirT cytochrome c family, N-terminal region
VRRLVPKSFFNPASFVGAAIAAISFGLILFLFLLEAFAGHQKPYMGIIALVILPAFLVLGLVIAASGMILERRRQRTEGATVRRRPSLDLNDPHQRSVFGFFSGLTVILLLFSAFGSYQAYEFTESVQFCGEICHSVMKPEYTAYLYSPHARVSCAQCHVGSGADWYVKSKLSGAYQVYSVLFHKYSRPIETPVRSLRPAQQTCEQCHWPKHFFAEKQVVKNYFLSDEKNTEWWISLLMKIGGGNNESGPTSGIHWHMNISNQINYIATDSQRQVIPWVQSKRPDGTVITYKFSDGSMTDEQLKSGEMRKMDCIDCHNRPTHIYRPPNESINEAMTLGWINPRIPSIKATALEALVRPFATEEGAMDSIGIFVREQYAQRYPEASRTMKADIDTAIERLKKIYSRNFFPEMRVSWKHYPNNIGHLYAPGCFRCHDGKHVGDNGKILSRDCNACHIILAQKLDNEKLRLSLGGIQYRHPVDIGDAWKEMNCSDCHGGG